MIDHCLYIDFVPTRSLQEQLRETLVASILAGVFPIDEPLPSCRKLSCQLNISRNTVALVYESLLNDGYLISRPRSGYYLHPDYHQPDALPDAADDGARSDAAPQAPEWSKRFNHCPSNYLAILKPGQWMDYPYPFIYGQPNTQLFPLEQWRETTRKVMGSRHDHGWLYDNIDQDVTPLVEQVRKRILPKRGIIARGDEILITMGSQNALYLLARLLLNKNTRIGVENPVFREAINTFSLQDAQIIPHALDSEGIRLTEASRGCDYFYVTPSHQAPTGINMSNARKTRLLEHAREHDQIIIEDDYDSESSFDPHPGAALKAGDIHNRVIYVSSLSKSLSPGLRLGYVVAPAELIDELRALRRLVYRHPPTSIQYQMAHFLAQGYYETYLHRYRADSARRWNILNDALNAHLPECSRIPGSAPANAFWIRTPEAIDTQQLAWRAAHSGVLIEPGQAHFLDSHPPENYFRLGFHAIQTERIEPGVARLAEAFHLTRSAHRH
ncbi:MULTISPECIES: PLP-dependent aminotransferase family protein [Brenneria]|uniref:PLP-dependent aminotransferase family protein n=1 Tax=Brenneria nigrifluens DSM 30175 = ATCC 13028 TaxID=1121120 RepID=A0A2U1ULL6_9GAMM|nr:MULTISPECIES: PLP-dependent aminotransferase family protein [Brenneria]EHD19526.1 transcriptional regulator, GntR family with aminotransferase domain [Brenneria sp. EniD312]PWC22559.1 PLP-dependent aminotransferase family protein [Brenneria nigrifluens DSM 30175 = ATCC 13028]QCR02799.1 PLP-dependent aminotransferase family protein [Brenneria nigrifluens DSM 30175 = ATCC 13028]